MNQNETASISVIVACRNEIKHIGRFLNSVFAQDLAGRDAEFLVADGMSEDGTRNVLKRFQRVFPALRMIDNPGRITSTGLNHAIREARGEIIIRMDAHSEYAPDYICRCLEVLEETNADNVGGPVLTRADGYMAQAIALAYHTKFACGGAKSHDPQFEGLVDTVVYGCWRKSTLERIGLFDENMFRSQDDELNRRLIASGGRVWQSPKIISWYRPRTSLTALFHQYFQYGFWKVSVSRKHGRLACWRHIVPGACLLIGFALLLGATGAILNGSVWWRSVFLTAGTGLAGLYLAASTGAAFLAARRSGWRFLRALPIVFATYHLSYGLGFLVGLAYNPATWDRPSPLRRALTVITR